MSFRSLFCRKHRRGFRLMVTTNATCDIYRMGHRFKMLWIDAMMDSAFMVKLHSLWHFSYNLFVHGSMGIVRAIWITDHSISALVDACCPEPAPRGWIYSKFCKHALKYGKAFLYYWGVRHWIAMLQKSPVMWTAKAVTLYFSIAVWNFANARHVSPLRSPRVEPMATSRMLAFGCPLAMSEGGL